MEQQQQIRRLTHERNSLSPPRPKRRKKKKKADTKKRKPLPRRKRRAMLRELAQPIARAPPAAPDRAVWIERNPYMFTQEEDDEEEPEEVSPYEEVDAAIVGDGRAAAAAALRSAGNRLNRSPRRQRKGRREKRAQEHAGFGAVVERLPSPPSENRAERLARLAQPLPTKETESRPQRLTRLLSHLEARRARVVAELSAQQSYLEALGGGQGRSPRDAALRESLQAIHLRTLEEETAAEAERLASMLVGIDAEYATVEAEAVRAGVVKARRAVSPERRRHSSAAQPSVVKPEPRRLGGSFGQAERVPRDLGQAVRGPNLPATWPKSLDMAMATEPILSTSTEPVLSAWVQGEDAVLQAERQQKRAEFEAVRAARAEQQESTRARLAGLRPRSG